MVRDEAEWAFFVREVGRYDLELEIFHV